MPRYRHVVIVKRQMAVTSIQYPSFPDARIWHVIPISHFPPFLVCGRNTCLNASSSAAGSVVPSQNTLHRLLPSLE